MRVLGDRRANGERRPVVLHVDDARDAAHEGEGRGVEDRDEKWSLLVIRELSLGVTRFDEIQRSTGAPRDILSDRLRKLAAAGVIVRIPYQERPLRHKYHLTESGNELRPILLSIAQWGERWTGEAPELELVHACGEAVDVRHTCAHCGEPLTGLDVTLRSRY